ncbi:MAG: LPP20 family lipoprotein [Pseudomonadota bacterium]
MRRSSFTLFMLLLAVCATAGCMPVMSALEALPGVVQPRTASLATMKDDLEPVSRPTPSLALAAAPVLPPIEGRGLSQVSKQPGASMNQRRLNAIRAARLEALRDLTEQVHGIAITADTTVGKAVVTTDRLRGVVSGEIRGARTVRITPKGSDGYEVVLSLDPDVVSYIVRAARLGG